MSPTPDTTHSLIPWDSVHLTYRINELVVGIERKDLPFVLEIAASNYPFAETIHIWVEIILYKKMELLEEMTDAGYPKMT